MNHQDQSAGQLKLREASDTRAKAWVKPTLDRLPLKEAMGGIGGEDDQLDGHSS